MHIYKYIYIYVYTYTVYDTLAGNGGVNTSQTDVAKDFEDTPGSYIKKFVFLS